MLTPRKSNTFLKNGHIEHSLNYESLLRRNTTELHPKNSCVIHPSHRHTTSPKLSFSVSLLFHRPFSFSKSILPWTGGYYTTMVLPPTPKYNQNGSQSSWADLFFKKRGVLCLCQWCWLNKLWTFTCLDSKSSESFRNISLPTLKKLVLFL